MPWNLTTQEKKALTVLALLATICLLGIVIL